MSPWILGAWRFLPDWSLNASAGASRQFPDLDAVLGVAGSSDLVPEQATHVDVSIERTLASGTRVQAALFNRVESDVLRGPDMDARRFQSLLLDPSTPDRYRNALHGVSRGIELVVAPMHVGRVSGSMSYTYATARQNDAGTQETFWNDVDLRHAFDGATVVRIGRQSTAGIILRAASGVPLPGYFDVTNGRLVLGDRRNEIRLPPYVRLDPARAEDAVLLTPRGNPLRRGAERAEPPESGNRRGNPCNRSPAKPTASRVLSSFAAHRLVSS